MKRFLAVYTASTAARERSGWDKLSDADRGKREKEGVAAWMAWGEKHKAAIVQDGDPLGKTKRTGLNGVTDIKNNLAAYVVVQAENHETAARMFEGHPHFTIFPCDAVDVMPLLSGPEE